MGGASIPRYEDSGGRPPIEVEEEIALWALLYTDPLYELRLIRHRSTSGEGVAPGRLAPSEALDLQVRTFTPSDRLQEQLRRLLLAEEFSSALAWVAAAPEFAEAIRTAPSDPLEHRRVIARAVLARTLVQATRVGEPDLDGHARDALLQQFTDELGGYGLGVVSWLRRPFRGLAVRAVTQRMQRDRGSITDSAAPGAGDILRYQARGSGVRRYIRDVVESAPGEGLTVLAHSLGGIACVDMLVEAPIERVDRLVTVGSQAPFLYEIGALVSLNSGDPLPSHFPTWVNIYDDRDFLSYVAAGVFPGRAFDIEVDNGQPFPQSHSAYWSNRAVWDAVCAPVVV
jgi:pimeloyl-ACP methyl ester carboxylesterase